VEGLIVEPMTLDAFDVLVDLQTGAISLVLPVRSEFLEDGDGEIEMECVTPDDEFAPRE